MMKTTVIITLIVLLLSQADCRGKQSAQEPINPIQNDMRTTDVPLTMYKELIPRINALSTFALFKEDRTSLQSERLPFFHNYDLLMAQTFSTIPPVTMHYLWNPEDNDIIKMDGTRDAVFDNLDKLMPLISDSTAVPYVTFVLDNVQSEDGTLRVVQTLDGFEFSDTPSPEERELLEKTIRPARLSRDGDDYLINCIIILGSNVFEADIKLAPNGIFEFTGEKMLIEDMHCVRQLFLE